jgi:stearoyl-CoA desaturase (delta-9 desaturase)
VFGFNALYFVLVLPVVASVTVSNALNWFGHKNSFISYRNYELKDHSQNNWIMAVLAFGEGWHNNHHGNPSSWHSGERWWEWDLMGRIIQLIKK